jgi:hypothetical protein
MEKSNKTFGGEKSLYLFIMFLIHYFLSLSLPATYLYRRRLLRRRCRCLLQAGVV